MTPAPDPDPASPRVLSAIAGAPCPECQQPSIRAEFSTWRRDDDGRWEGTCHLVCANDHRTLVSKLDDG